METERQASGRSHCDLHPAPSRSIQRQTAPLCSPRLPFVHTMSITMHSRSMPQDENAQSVMRPAKGGGGLSARSGGLQPQQQASVVKPLGLSGGGPPQKSGGLQPEKRRALGDITNSGGGLGGGGGGGGGGLKGKTVLVASTLPLSVPASSRTSKPQLQKLSAPIQHISVAAPLPALGTSSSSDEDMAWLQQVDGPKGDGLQRQHLEEDDELASSASRAVVRAMPKGKAMFTCRPNSPIPWERTAEENAYNGPPQACSRARRFVAAHLCSLAPILFFVAVVVQLFCLTRFRALVIWMRWMISICSCRLLTPLFTLLPRGFSSSTCINKTKTLRGSIAQRR